MGYVLILIFLFCCSIPPSYAYDSLDPNGNITITWDYVLSTGAGLGGRYDAKVSIYNFQLFRHVEDPGWRLNWEWQGDEVIWEMWGAEATEQGNCSKFQGSIPHNCQKNPVIIDLLPGAGFKKQFSNCCKGGVLTSMTQESSKYGASFKMNVGASSENTSFVMPQSFSLGLSGYTCGPPFEVAPTKSTEDGGRRWTQALGTWNVTCSFSQVQASPFPSCCVSLSAFYNDTIVQCPRCSCGCQGQLECVKSGEEAQFLQLPHKGMEKSKPLVRCSQHMCPIHVHWHVKESYIGYWRAKMTVTNLNLAWNYSQWTLAVLHPNLKSVNQVFSFNYKPLNQFGNTNDSGMFWGINNYNDVLLQSGPSGNVQSEILLHKDPGNFTFHQGWAFPRRVSFNGMECVMPPPDQYPSLPNTAFHLYAPPVSFILFLSIFFVISSNELEEFQC